MLLLSLKFKSLINWQILQSGKSLAHLIILEKLINIFERCSESVFSFLYSFIMEAYDDMKEHSFLSINILMLNILMELHRYYSLRKEEIFYHFTIHCALLYTDCYPILDNGCPWIENTLSLSAGCWWIIFVFKDNNLIFFN